MHHFSSAGPHNYSPATSPRRAAVCAVQARHGAQRRRWAGGATSALPASGESPTRRTNGSPSQIQPARTTGTAPWPARTHESEGHSTFKLSGARDPAPHLRGAPPRGSRAARKNAAAERRSMPRPRAEESPGPGPREHTTERPASHHLECERRPRRNTARARSPTRPRHLSGSTPRRGGCAQTPGEYHTTPPRCHRPRRSPHTHDPHTLPHAPSPQPAIPSTCARSGESSEQRGHHPAGLFLIDKGRGRG